MKALIETVVTLLTGAPFFAHGPAEWQNILSDTEDVTYPLVYLDQPITFNGLVRGHGMIDKEYPLKMLFLDKTIFEGPPDGDKQTVSAAMLVLVNEFMLELQNIKDSSGRRRIKSLTSVRAVEVFELYDANLAGWILTLTVTPLDDSSICV